MSKKYLYCVALVWVLFSCSSKKEKETVENEKMTQVVDDKPTEIKAILLEYQNFNCELISNGTIGARNKAELYFQSQDQIFNIYVKNGQKVAKLEKLAELDMAKVQNELTQANESVERAHLDLQDILIGQGYSLYDSTTRIPPEVMKIAEIRSNYGQSQINFLMARNKLDAATLYAPFDGVVANLNIKEYNQPGSEPFCTIIDNQSFEVTFNILESELPLIKLNDRIIVSPFSQPAYNVESRISEINPMIDKNGMVKIKALIKNKDNKLYDGMNVKVRIQRLLDKQLVIPKSALVLRNNRKVVFTLKNGQAIWNYVEIAQENTDSYVLIKDKINAGDSVIYAGNMNLMHQVPVIVNQ